MINKYKIRNHLKLIKQYYQILSDISQFPFIFVASDDIRLIDPIYTMTRESSTIVNPFSFISFDNGTIISNQRYTDNALLSAIIDVFLLTETGIFIVKTNNNFNGVLYYIKKHYL